MDDDPFQFFYFDALWSLQMTTSQYSMTHASIFVIRHGKHRYGEGDTKLRLPLIALILRRIINEIRNDYGGINLKTALCVAFAAFLQSDEFTWDEWSRAIRWYLKL
jgi:hypothetical protein